MFKITDITSQGLGVCKVDGKVVFVPNVIIGEDVEIEITNEQKSFSTGKVKAMCTSSPHRRTPPCKHFGKCGGCNLMHMEYCEQLKVKENIVKSALERIGKQSCKIERIIPANSEFNYRNKAAFPVKHGKIGYFANGTHDIVEIDSCLLLDDSLNTVLNTMRPFVKECNGISHVVARVTGGETMVTVVTNENIFPHEAELIKVLSPLNVNSVNINYNDNPKTILGRRTDCIYGSSTIPYSIMGSSFSVSPTAFLQVNTEQTDALYKKALSLVDLTGKTVIDAYCGIGTISLAIAKRAKRVIGIEVNPAAIYDADKAAKANGVTNAEFVCGKCESVIPRVLKEIIEPPILFLDPPRAGLERSLIDTIAASVINRLVYISCNPATLARDMRLLADRGFTVESVTPVDMFPNTGHVETVVLMSRVKGK